MPFIRFTASEYCTLLTISISLNREIISPCSRCVKKGLIYIVLASLFRRQPSFYLECTKANTQVSYNICSIPLNECTCFTIYY
jgi:hypothetical protein